MSTVLITAKDYDKLMAQKDEIERLKAALLHIAEGEPGVPYSCIDKRAIALAALKGTDDD